MFFFFSIQLSCCIRTFCCSYHRPHWEGNRWLLRPELSGAVNSTPMNDQYWVQCTVGTNPLTPWKSTQTETDRGCSTQLVICQAFYRHFKHSRLILRFMLHLCRILLVIWLIKWLLGGAGLFIVCMATCLLDWPALQVRTHLERNFPATVLYPSFCTVWCDNWLVFIVIEVAYSMSVV